MATWIHWEGKIHFLRLLFLDIPRYSLELALHGSTVVSFSAECLSIRQGKKAFRSSSSSLSQPSLDSEDFRLQNWQFSDQSKNIIHALRPIYKQYDLYVTQYQIWSRFKRSYKKRKEREYTQCKISSIHCHYNPMTGFSCSSAKCFVHFQSLEKGSNTFLLTIFWLSLPFLRHNSLLRPF